jgi:hypothetical protein
MCEDGLIRLSVDEILSVPLVHLASGLDEETELASACGTPTAISGYTEWASMTEPAITLGWDWRIDTSCEPPTWVRVGLPRSNVMLVETDGTDAPWQHNLETLATIVDAVNWREQIPLAVAARYAPSVHRA